MSKNALLPSVQLRHISTRIHHNFSNRIDGHRRAFFRYWYKIFRVPFFYSEALAYRTSYLFSELFKYLCLEDTEQPEQTRGSLCP